MKTLRKNIIYDFIKACNTFVSDLKSIIRMPSALDTANVFIKLSQPEVGDVITNLKLQKLLYYAQGFHLAMYGEPLFDEELKAWDYGPVVEEVYHHFKSCGANPIEMDADIDTSMFTQEQLNLIEEVNEVYGQFSALKLMHLTHGEPPWNNTAKNHVIRKSVLSDYFVTQLNS